MISNVKPDSLRIFDGFDNSGFFKLSEKKSALLRGNIQQLADGFDGRRAVVAVFQNPDGGNQQVRPLIQVQTFHRTPQQIEIIVNLYYMNAIRGIPDS